MNTSREEGFYWVKNSAGIYQIAFWVNSNWLSVGKENGRPEGDFEVVSDLLEPSPSKVENDKPPSIKKTNLERYPGSIKYKTNLDYPKEFFLADLPPRRNNPNPLPLQPLEVDDYILLPFHPSAEIFAGKHLTYKVIHVEGDQVSLEAIGFRVTFLENE
jgi:hypothetical protein